MVSVWEIILCLQLRKKFRNIVMVLILGDIRIRTGMRQPLKIGLHSEFTMHRWKVVLININTL